jgi:alkylhydroperoxidase family enzyme
MAWIKTIGVRDPEMSPEIGKALQEAAVNLPSEYQVGEDIANILKTHTLDPEALRTAFSAGLHLIAGPSPLTRREREMINTVTSTANRCFY